MPIPKDILVTTTPLIQNLKIKQYLKPVSAQIVTGAGFFSDFVASFTDLVGGNSATYQRRLSAMYSQAIELLQSEAFQIGANCIVGLNLNMAEISGKGKEMFMISAVGTAVILEGYDVQMRSLLSTEKVETVSVDRLNVLKRKKLVLEKAGTFVIDDDIWEFITQYQVDEMFPHLVTHLRKIIMTQEAFDKFYKKTVDFLNGLPEATKLKLLYEAVMKEDNADLAIKLCDLIGTLRLLDFDYITLILNLPDFDKQKRALRIIMYNKPFYNKEDVERFKTFIAAVKEKFAGKSFKPTDISAAQAITKIEERISLISECIH